MKSSFSQFLGAGLKVVLLVLLLMYACDNHSKIKRLRRDVRELKAASVRLTPGTDGYQVIRHDLGSATIRLRDVKADAKGSVITLVIGNLTSVNISGATMTISYPDEAIERSYEFDVQQIIVAGKETKIQLILEGVKPSGLSYIYVSNFHPKGIWTDQGN